MELKWSIIAMVVKWRENWASKAMKRAAQERTEIRKKLDVEILWRSKEQRSVNKNF